MGRRYVDEDEDTPRAGHNSKSKGDDGSGIAADELKQFVERIERLNEDKKSVQDDIRDVFGEAKGRGFCVKTLRQIIRERAIAPTEREEREAMLELYKSALGMF